MSQKEIMDAAQYAADIFGSLLGMEGHAKNLEMRMEFGLTSVTLEIVLTPEIRR